MILKYFAPSVKGIGLITKKIIQIISILSLNLKLKKKSYNRNHYTIYLPSFSIENTINFFPVWMKSFGTSFHQRSISLLKNNLSFFQLTIRFEQNILSCEGIISNAGFETTSEALYLNKKLLIIPMKNQFEQQYNASILVT